MEWTKNTELSSGFEYKRVDVQYNKIRDYGDKWTVEVQKGIPRREKKK